MPHSCPSRIQRIKALLRAAWIHQHVPALDIFRNLNEADIALTDHQNVTTALERNKF